MLGLELLLAGMLHLSPTPVVEEIKCQVKTAPKINILPSKSRVQYDFTKSKAELNQVDVDTVSPYGPNHQTMVSGLMSGSISLSHKIEFLHETYHDVGQGCLFLRSVDIKIHIDPIVFIASELPRGGCMHNAVLSHERKHVKEDQLIVNKYSNIIGKAVLALAKSQDSAFGPYDIARVPFVQQNVQRSFGEVIDKYNRKMNEERQERQQAIDNLEEYESIGTRCNDK